MNFTSDVKKEIITKGASHGRAALSAFVRTSGQLGFNDGKPSFFLVSETENVAEFFMQLFSREFGFDLMITHATVNKMSGRGKLLLECPQARAAEVIRGLKLFKRGEKDFREGISVTLTGSDEGKIDYIKGAFLGGGSCSVPSAQAKTGYHLEIAFSQQRTAEDFCGILEEFELLAKLTERKDLFVVYIKSKEAISDFLSIIGAENALKKFSALVEKRDSANRENRVNNCMAGNADKTAIAAVGQVVAIRKLHEKGGLDNASEELKELARARLLNPSKSLQELANLLKVSKSCLNHRMRKLMDMAKKTEEKE